MKAVGKENDKSVNKEEEKAKHKEEEKDSEKDDGLIMTSRGLRNGYGVEDWKNGGGEDIEQVENRDAVS